MHASTTVARGMSDLSWPRPNIGNQEVCHGSEIGDTLPVVSLQKSVDNLRNSSI
jgi:hypothetical protein